MFAYGPGFHVIFIVFEHRPTQLQMGINGMQRVGELDIKRRLVFGRHELAVRLLAHLHPGNRVAARFEIADLRRRIPGRAVHHGDRHRGRYAARHAALKYDVEPGCS